MSVFNVAEFIRYCIGRTVRSCWRISEIAIYEIHFVVSSLLLLAIKKAASEAQFTFAILAEI